MMHFMMATRPSAWEWVFTYDAKAQAEGQELMQER